MLKLIQNQCNSMKLVKTPWQTEKFLDSGKFVKILKKRKCLKLQENLENAINIHRKLKKYYSNAINIQKILEKCFKENKNKKLQLIMKMVKNATENLK